jgi:hypothetical protein
MYSANTLPTMQYTGKYPVMTSEYESINVPGLYFAGTLAHGKDHLKSVGVCVLLPSQFLALLERGL